MNDLFGTSTIKMISVRQPWADLIVCGDKDIENRKWATKYRGPVFIHASLRADESAMKTFRFRRDVPVGGIVGIAEIVDCVSAHSSQWFEGPFGFVLKRRRPLPFHPMRGRLSLFNAPKELIERVYKVQIAEYLAA